MPGAPRAASAWLSERRGLTAACAPSPGCTVGRLVNKADFERLLGSRHWARSAHFAVHHVPASPQRASPSARQALGGELSTTPAPVGPKPVDDLPAGHWLGCVVPKRHAKRAVTRNLVKRQVRVAFAHHVATLPAGLWLVRLRQPFALAEYPSAYSKPLARAARAELDGLLAPRAP